MEILSKTTKEFLLRVKEFQKDADSCVKPPSGGAASANEMVLPFSLVKNTRGYLERVVHQINGSYENGWYDACAVMIRRLTETLIIEAFEHHKIDHKIKNSDGDFLYLRELINKALAEKAWNLGRNAKQALPRLKDVGDQSAHNRRFLCQRQDIDKIIPDLRIVTQELIFIAGLK